MRSKFEEKVAANLTKLNVAFEYEPYQVQYWSPVRSALCNLCNGAQVVKARWYTPDFVLKNGVIIEAKGKFTSANRSAIIDILDTSVYIDRRNFRLLFMADNTFGKKGKRYSDWCNQNGIIFHVSRQGEIPQEWIN